MPGVGLPTVLANCYDADDAHPSVAPDEVRAGETVADFLVEVMADPSLPA